MREITQVSIVPMLDGWLLCQFNNGEVKYVDIRPSMIGALQKLHHHDVF